MGTQLGKAVAADYYQRGGSASGVLGILDNMIKQREEQKTYGKDITKQLLGVEGVARGVAKKAGLPYEESQEKTESLRGQKLLNEQREQAISGSSPTQARSFAASVLDDLQKDTTNLVIAIRKGLTKEQYIQSARTKLLDVYDILPESSRVYFDKAVGDLYDSTSMAYGGAKKGSPKQSEAPKKSRYTVTPIQ